MKTTTHGRTNILITSGIISYHLPLIMCNNTFAVNISLVIACKLVLHVSGVDSMWQNKLLVNKNY